MLNNGDLNSSSTSIHVQRTLGIILSLPEYLSPLSSPGRRWENNSTAHMKCSSTDFINVVNIKKEIHSDQQEDAMKNAQFSDQLLEPALISNIPFCSNHLCLDHELLFDCINEVIMELCFCPPWASFITPRTRVFSTIKSIIHEVQEAVYWHLLPLPLPHKLDQIVRKDMGKGGKWLEIKCYIDCIGFETRELILEELLEELTLNDSEHSKTDESILGL
ncbi:unnamed protein product [Cochlearia groenlandica]